MSTINTLKKKYDIRVPKRTGFDIDAHIELGDSDALEGVILRYTHKATGAQLFFLAKTGYSDYAGYKRHCTFYANRYLSDEEILRQLHSEAWQHKLSKHDSEMYLGPKTAVDVPIDYSGGEDEFITLFRRTLQLIRSALKTLDPMWTSITEDVSVSGKSSAVVELDRTVDTYQKLLHKEFNN